MMKRKLMMGAMVAVMALAATGCAGSKSGESAETTATVQETETAAEVETEAKTEETKKDTSEDEWVDNSDELLAQGYKLVWEDHFEGTELNMDDWNYEYHEPGWVNNELQEYVDSAENIYVEDGKLVIKAVKTEENGQVSYTSGRVNTQNKHDFKYGRFEARIKVPSGQGFLPAFWMMPTNENLYGQWPKCGEIDIMEVLGNATTVNHGTIHYGEPHASSQGSAALSLDDYSRKYHVFACEWEPSEIRWYVDGKLYHRVSEWYTKREGFGETTYPAPFDQPFYMILNLAVGGDWPGNPEPDAVFGENAELKVDFVRVFQKDSYDENVTMPVKEVKLPEPDETGNFVKNSNFPAEEDINDGKDWKFLLATTGDATAEIVDNTLHIATTNAGDVDYSVQVLQANIPVEKGYQYRLSFDAWASEARTMITAITAPNNNWVRYFPDTKLDLTTQKQNYVYEFTMTDKTDATARVEFNLGNQPSTADVYITNVRFEKVSDGAVIEESKTVLPDGNYVYNGAFQQGTNRMDYWTVESQCDGTEAVVTNENNIRELKVTVPETVTGLEQVIVKQDELAISENKEYVLSFEAYADTEKTIKTTVAGQTFESALTLKKQEFKYKFDTKEKLTDKVLQFMLGVGGTINVDNVRIQEDCLLINGDFSNGMTAYEVYTYTASDVSYVVDSLNEDNAFSIDISNTGDIDWKIQLKQYNINLEKGKKYSISFDAKCSMDRKMMYALQRDGSADDDWTAYSGSQIIDLTSDYQTFSHVFEMTYDTDPATILSITMGAVEGIQLDEKHTIRIDNIKLEEIKE